MRDKNACVHRSRHRRAQFGVGPRPLQFERLEERYMLAAVAIPVNARPPDLNLSEVPRQSVVAGSPFTLNLRAAGAITADLDGNGEPTGDILRFQLDPYLGSQQEGLGAPSISPDGQFTWTPSADARGDYQFVVILTDSGQPPLSDADTLTVYVVPSSLYYPPSLDLNGPTPGIDSGVLYVRGAGGVSIFSPDVSIDSSSGSLISATVRIVNWTAGETLVADTAGTNITVTDEGGPGVLQLSGTAAVADYVRVLKTVRYDHAPPAPLFERSVEVAVANIFGSSVTARIVISISDMPSETGTYTFPNTTLGTVLLTNATRMLIDSTFSFTGDADLPLIGKIHLSGTSSIDFASYNLQAGLDEGLSLGPFTLSAATVELTQQNLTLAGEANVATIGNLSFVGTIDAGGGYLLTASPRNVSLGPYEFSKVIPSLTGEGLSLSGDVELPAVGKVRLKGKVSPDLSTYTLQANLDGVKLGSISLTDATVQVSEQRISLTGKVQLAKLGAVSFEGTVEPNGKYKLRSTSQKLKLGLFTLDNCVVEITEAGLSISSDTDLPVVGSVQLTGRISDDFSTYSLTAPQHDVTIGRFAIRNAAIALSNEKGLSAKGNLELPIVGTMTFEGTIDADGNYKLEATPERLPSLLGGLVRLDTLKLTLSATGVSLEADANIEQWDASIKLIGTIHPDESYDITAAMTIRVAGFEFPDATLTLSSSEGNQVRFNLPFDKFPVPISIGNGGGSGFPFGGSIGLDGAWTIHGTYPNPVTIGYITISNITLTVAHGPKPDENYLQVTGLASIAGLEWIVAADLNGQLFQDGRVDFLIDAKLLPIAGFQLGDSKVEVTNNNPGRELISTMHTVVGLDGLPEIQLDGEIDANGNYALTSTQDLRIGGFKLADGHFTLTKEDGFTVRGGAVAGIPGVPEVEFSGDFEPNGDYSLIGSGKLGPASGKFTLDKQDGMGFMGSVNIPFGQTVNIQGTIQNDLRYHLEGSLQGSNKTFAKIFPAASFALDSGTGLSFDSRVDFGLFTTNLHGTISNNGSVTFAGTGASPRATLIGTVAEINGSVTSPAKYQLTAELNSKLLGIDLKELTVTNSGFSISAKAPVIGNVTLTGTIKNGKKYTLTGTLKDSKFGVAFKQLTLSSGTLTVLASVPFLKQDFNLNGSISSGKDFRLSANLGRSKFGVQLKELTLTEDGLTLKAKLPTGDYVDLDGSIKSANNYSFTGSFSKTFSVKVKTPFGKKGGDAHVTIDVELSDSGLSAGGSTSIKVAGIKVTVTVKLKNEKWSVSVG